MNAVRKWKFNSQGAILALFLATQGTLGCVSTNAPDPTVVTAAIHNTPSAAPAPTAAPIVEKSGGNTPVYVSATAAITAGGGFAHSSAVTVFASIGDPGTPSIQTGTNLMKVSGAGALAFEGTFSDNR